MNAKTEMDSIKKLDELSSPVRVWLLLFTGMTLALVFFSDIRTEYGQGTTDTGFHVTVMPWIEATKITLTNGFDVFSGKPLSPPTNAQRASILIGLLLSLIAGPTLLFFGLRGLFIESGSAGKSNPWISTLGLIMGTVLMFTIAISSLPVAATQWKVSSSIREAQFVSDQRDRSIASLAFIARNARAYCILPSSTGGGHGSFAGYTIPSKLQSNAFGTCDVQSVSDSVLVLRAIPSSSTGQVVFATLERSGVLQYRFEKLGKE